MRIIKYFGGLLFTLACITGCNNGPKVISAESNKTGVVTPSGIFSEENNSILDETINNRTSFTEDLHTVIIKEVLPASM